MVDDVRIVTMKKMSWLLSGGRGAWLLGAIGACAGLACSSSDTSGGGTPQAGTGATQASGGTGGHGGTAVVASGGTVSAGGTATGSAGTVSSGGKIGRASCRERV